MGIKIGDSEVDGIGLGTAQFAFRDGSVDDSVDTVKAAMDAGVRLIDTALAYTRAGIENYALSVVARALREHRCPVPLIAAKGGHWRAGDEFPVDGRPATLRRHCTANLRALGVDQLDLYQLHHVDPAVSLSSSVAALEDLRREGLVAAIGLSNVSQVQIDEALAIAPIAAVQNRLSYTRPDDLATAYYCADKGIAYLAYMPFDGPNASTAESVRAVASRRAVSTQRIQLAWLRAQSSNIIPLVGASRPASIRDSAELIELTEDEITELESTRP